MRYIVFGASGFVGTYTIKTLIDSMAKNIIESGEIIALDNRALPPESRVLDSKFDMKGLDSSINPLGQWASENCIKLHLNKALSTPPPDTP